ncbi:Hvo_1808 family surface protein [Halobaculum sp. MBLA0143]|uniref:Hvo_1808 family surface protein n=1 Tax=Halobaculum sp. MBLA0143 TaxID=3079933 RepID=UPI0035251F54
MSRALPAVLVCLCLVLAGCGGAAAPPRTPSSSPLVGTDAPERLGVEDGVAADARLNVTASDGLTRDELGLVLDRTMARVELIRGLEFTQPVGLRVLSRAEYREEAAFGATVAPQTRRLREQQFEATFLLGEAESVGAAYDELYGSAVAGYYDAASNEIVVVGGSRPRIDTRTLAHELVHALQNQHFGGRRPDGHDARTAYTGLVEGDARYVDTLYAERCDTEWSCLPTPTDDGDGGDGVDYDRGLFAVVYQPYADGAGFVHALHERGGWDAVNAAYGDPPVSTEQTIHPEAYPDERPVAVTVTDRSGPAWERVESRTLGELGAFTALWGAGAVPRERYYEADGPYSSRTYAAEASTGWAGDRLVAYADGDRAAYVWKLRWDTTADARAFAAAYREGLERQGAGSVGDDTYVIPSGGFADAFRVTREGDTVVVTNAPTVAALDEVRTPRSDDAA